jgi:CBS domain-containing protein
MATVNQMLISKGNEVYSIAPDATVLDALRLMAEKDVGALIIMDGEVLTGIFSERDYARKIALQGKSSRTTPVWAVMTDDVVCVSPDLAADKCMAIMTDKRIRHLPVLDDGRVVGIISIGDVVKSIMADQQVLIRHLEDYILS